MPYCNTQSIEICTAASKIKNLGEVPAMTLSTSASGLTATRGGGGEHHNDEPPQRNTIREGQTVRQLHVRGQSCCQCSQILPNRTAIPIDYNVSGKKNKIQLI